MIPVKVQTKIRVENGDKEIKTMPLQLASCQNKEKGVKRTDERLDNQNRRVGGSSPSPHLVSDIMYQLRYHAHKHMHNK